MLRRVSTVLRRGVSATWRQQPATCSRVSAASLLEECTAVHHVAPNSMPDRRQFASKVGRQACHVTCLGVVRRLCMGTLIVRSTWPGVALAPLHY